MCRHTPSWKPAAPLTLRWCRLGSSGGHSGSSPPPPPPSLQGVPAAWQQHLTKDRGPQTHSRELGCWLRLLHCCSLPPRFSESAAPLSPGPVLDDLHQTLLKIPSLDQKHLPSGKLLPSAASFETQERYLNPKKEKSRRPRSARKCLLAKAEGKKYRMGQEAVFCPGKKMGAFTKDRHDREREGEGRRPPGAGGCEAAMDSAGAGSQDPTKGIINNTHESEWPQVKHFNFF